ncbi:uncharacterized protein LOC116109534 [Pistacia vera]|uniref:uncharacterized protein LOC116109534 n=1 Tax=Pistacia vera TaxID=55513 RepID=UPI0012636DB9|nr:uncharacterized protein LOC116109534 [Pistacia vera]
MEEELAALQKNWTWQLVPRLASMYVIGSHWVFKSKLKLIGLTDELVVSFIQLLSSELAMKDLGPIHHFLGIEISQTPDALHLSQTHYALTILKKTYMVDCKPLSTPLEAKTKYSHEDTLLEDQGYFRSIVGAL